MVRDILEPRLGTLRDRPDDRMVFCDFVFEMEENAKAA